MVVIWHLYILLLIRIITPREFRDSPGIQIETQAPFVT